MSLIPFLAEVVICSGILFGYYFLFLRNNRFHQFNRYYVLTSAAFSFLLPLLRIPVFYSGPDADSVLISTLRVITVSDWEDEFVITAGGNFLSSFFTFQNIAVTLYLGVMAILLVKLASFITYINKLTRIYKREQINEVWFYNTPEPGTPFSFFNLLFWNQNILLNSEKGQQILRHELYHVRAAHSFDIIGIKCLTIFFWFNPFFHLFLKEIKAIHEFLADEHASRNTDKYDYAELLVTEAINSKKVNVSNPFFHNQIKRRIIMITTNHSSRFSYARRLMALPLVFVLFCAFALNVSKQYTVKQFYSNTDEQITAVIDAGHGGSDPGVRGPDGVSEKDLTLSIAQKIKDLGGTYGVNIVLTRDKDVLPGNASNVKDGLINRTGILDKASADLLVSIHINGHDAQSATVPVNGFDIYVSNQNKHFDKSKLLGSAISGEIKKTYKIDDVLKENNSIWVLKTAVPAILIQCGFLTDKTDFDFIANKQNQEKIAHDILRGIVNYHRSVKLEKNMGARGPFQTDTVPAKELEKINPEHIESLVVNKDISIVKLKGGDSVIAKTEDLKNALIAKKKEQKNVGWKGSDNPADQGPVFTQLETEASFPGGPEAWGAYLSKSVKYPQEAQDKEIQGTIIVQFLVDTDGTVSDIEAVRGPDVGGLREEAVRLIKESGKWIPGKQNGRVVKSYKKQTITFRLEVAN